jgi:enoyl-CoA hydratase/carnithine racemase
MDLPSLTATRTELRAGDVEIGIEPGVIRAVIDRPGQRNAISTAVIDGLERAIELAMDTAARVLVISGAGGTFCSGADLRELEAMRSGGDPAQLEIFMARLGAVLSGLESAPFASLAVVDGHAVAGGCEILLACDLSVAATDSRMGDRHVEYGLVPAAGGSVRLPRTLARARANYLLLTGELISGRTAAEWGLVSAAVEPEQLGRTAEALIRRVASRSADGIGAVKQMIWNAGDQPRDEALVHELDLFLRHMACADVAEGLAAFSDRRAPVFQRDVGVQRTADQRTADQRTAEGDK